MLRRLIGFNLLSAIVLGIVGFFVGHWIGGQIAVGKDYLIGTDQNDVAVFMGFFVGSIGWLAGVGFLNYPIARLLGWPGGKYVYDEGTYVATRWPVGRYVVTPPSVPGASRLRRRMLANVPRVITRSFPRRAP